MIGLTPERALERATDFFETAAEQGRLNPEAEDELEAEIARLREKAAPRRAFWEDMLRWGVGIGAGLVLTGILTRSNSNDE